MKGIGQNFDDFMVEQGLYEEAKELAAKKLIAAQLAQEMENQHITKTQMAEKMHTSRSSVDKFWMQNITLPLVFWSGSHQFWEKEFRLRWFRFLLQTEQSERNARR